MGRAAERAVAVRSRRPPAAGGGAAPVAYKAPALEKGLDILELLAEQSNGLILSQIAHHLGRSVQEVYRVVLSLERRGYVTRRPPDDAFQISLKLFDLASKHPPLRRLLDAAQPIIQTTAAEVEEALMLSVVDGTRVRVVAVAENPAPIGFRVRIGTQNRLLSKASGRVLLAFQPPPSGGRLRTMAAEELQAEGVETARLLRRVDLIATRGYEMVSDETLRGITDVSFPILDADGTAQAALTMPFLSWMAGEVHLPAAAAKLHRAAAELSRQIGGALPQPDLPMHEIELPG